MCRARAARTAEEERGGSSHSSGGSGGGAGGSPEPQSNVEKKELSQTFISSGTSAKFDFPQKVTSIINISFDSKKTAGKTTTIVEMLKAKSTLVSELPSDEVYKSLNIWVGGSGFATPKNIENAILCFKVEKSWIKDKSIDQSSITLNRYSTKEWDKLSTNLLGEDDKYLYFKAETPGFSPFAITGKTKATKTEAQTTTGTKTQTANVDETQPDTQGPEQNNTNTATNAEHTQSPGTYGKGSKTPGFETIYGIIGLIGVFLSRRR